MQYIEWGSEPLVVPDHSGQFVGSLIHGFTKLRISAPDDFWTKVSVVGNAQEERKLLIGQLSYDATVARILGDLQRQKQMGVVNYVTIVDQILEMGRSEQGLDESVSYFWISDEEDRGSEWRTALVSLLKDDKDWYIILDENIDVYRSVIPQGSRISIMF